MIEISVITPTYNRAGLLPRVWQSLRNQNITLEWIVVDDGSNDNTSSVVEAFDDKRIIFIRFPKNRGANAARNAGARKAKGKFVIFLDSDDELYPESLAVMDEVMNGADAEIGAAAFACVIADTVMQFPFPNDGVVLREYDVICKNGFMKGDKILVYRREIFQEFLLPEDVRGCEHVFVYEVSKKWAYLMKNKPVSIVHRQADNLSNPGNMVARSFDMARSYEMILKNHSHLLQKCPEAMCRFLLRALYRYLVAGARTEAWRIYKSILKERHSLRQFMAATLLILSGGFMLSDYERWRIGRLKKKLTGH